MSQSNGTTKRALLSLIRRGDDATIRTGVRCACGREVKARNRKAKEAIVEAAGRGVPVKCAGCGG